MESQSIDRYQLIRQLGQGGMATVYLAQDPRFDREVAVKVLSYLQAQDVQLLARFRREAQTVANLEHAAIVPVYDFGEDRGLPYLVMRYMRGGSLRERIEKGPLELEEAIFHIDRIARALAFAHQRNIVHRDVKPANILFDTEQSPYLSDFGIVKLKANTTLTNLTNQGLIGTPAYMSPEQIEGEIEIDHRSDIYALTTIFYEMLTGQQPYRAKTTSGILVAHLHKPIPDIQEENPELPDGVNEIIQVGMSKDRKDRYQSALELSQAVRALLSGPFPDTVMIDRPPSVTTSSVSLQDVSWRDETLADVEIVPEERTEGESVVSLHGTEHGTKEPAPQTKSTSSPIRWLIMGALFVTIAIAGVRLSGIFPAQSDPEVTQIAEVLPATELPPTPTTEPIATMTAESPSPEPAISAEENLVQEPTLTSTPTSTATATAEPATPEPTDSTEQTTENNLNPAIEVEITEVDTRLYAGPSEENVTRGIFRVGDITEILATVCGNRWYKVVGPESNGWVNAEMLSILSDIDPLTIPIDTQFDTGGCTAQARIDTNSGELSAGASAPSETTAQTENLDQLSSSCSLSVRTDFSRIDEMRIFWSGVPAGVDALELTVVSANPNDADKDPLVFPNRIDASDTDTQERGFTVAYTQFPDRGYRIGTDFVLTLASISQDTPTGCAVTQTFNWGGPP